MLESFTPKHTLHTLAQAKTVTPVNSYLERTFSTPNKTYFDQVLRTFLRSFDGSNLHISKTNAWLC